MSREPSPQSSTSPVRGLALTGSGLIGVAMFCWQLASMSRSAWQSVLAPGPADPAQALAALAGSLAFVLTLWLFGALAVSLLAAIGPSGSALSRAAARGARLIAPLMLRNAVAALLGVAIAASPAVADAAPAGFGIWTGHPAGPPGSIPIGQVDDELSPAWAPPTNQGRVQIRSHGGRHSDATSTDLLSSPSRSAPARVPVEPQTRTGSIEPDLLPGWLPQRPDRPSRSPDRPSRSSTAHTPGTELVATPLRRRTKTEQDDEVVVRRGDTLWDIAARHLGTSATDGEIAREWPHWFTANRAVIGPDPDHLVPGARLRPPDSGQAQKRIGHPRSATDGKGR